MHPQIVNLDQVELPPLPPGAAPTGSAAERYGPRVAMLGRQIGARALGYNLIALAPGLRGFPFHSHRANEEAFLILSGQGEVRLGDQRHPIVAGDLIAAPAGGPDSAHQIINTGAVELRYLALSTRLPLDIIDYPDTGKYRALDEASGGFDVIGRHGGAVGYWDGE